MATKVTLPLLGQTMEEGTITKWFKAEGDSVEKGEPLLEVMTDKANMEVESPASGVVRKILAQPDDIVPVKGLIAIIGSADEPIDEEISGGSAGEPMDEVQEAPTTPKPPTQEQQPVEKPEPPTEQAQPPSAEADGSRVFASPRARKTAEELGIDISMLAGKGTGPEGRIVEQDVLSFAPAAKAGPRITPLAGKVAAESGVDVASVTGTGPGGKITKEDVLRATPITTGRRPSIGRTIPFTGMRKAIADNVASSIRTAPHVTLVSEVDMTNCVEMRRQIVPEIEKSYGVKVSFTAIFVKAAALGIIDHPIINAALNGDKIVIADEISIGVAVALEDGLIVPVIKQADAKPIYQIAQELDGLAAKARAGKLAPQEMQGGTFTISNLATYGVDSFNPIINPPQSAILGVCRTVEKPVIIEGQVRTRSMTNLCLSFDHRVMDGAPAAEYLARLKELLESPYLLLM